MRLEIANLKTFDVDRVDCFILDEKTNGEFINTIKYLSYHPNGKFIDRSIVVYDGDSNDIRAVMPCVETGDRIVSHPGTTFAGIIVDYRNCSLFDFAEYLEAIEGYLKEKGYRFLELRVTPNVFFRSPREDFLFYFLKNGYTIAGINSSNVIPLIPLKDEAKRLLNYKSKRRNHIKKSLKEGRFQLVRSELQAKDWEHLTSNLKEKYGVNPTHSCDEMLNLMRLFPENIEMYKAIEKDTGVCGAFSVVYKFKNVYHTQYLDLSYDYASQYPHLFLIHNLIAIASEQNFDYLSFGSFTENWGEFVNKGLYNYKNEYGGGAVNLYKLVKPIKEESNE